MSRGFVQAIGLVLTVALALGVAKCMPVAGKPVSQASTSIYADWEQVIGPGPTYYGVEYGWIDQDSDLFLERYRLLHANVLRVQVTQEYFEMVNDNDDPSVSEINFDVTFPLDVQEGKYLTYREMFSTLNTEFPDMHFHINIWLAARWNATNPNGYLGLGGAFPPLDYAEHREFIRELARWLVDTCGIAPERLSFSFINEPNLTPFFVGTQADLVQMATETRAALDEISPQIQMMGLDEVHGTSWTDTFYPQRPTGCCDAWTFHAYEHGVDALWNALRIRVEHLDAYGPVWATEFADTTNGSPDAQMDFSTREAALGFAEVTGRLWASGVDGIIHFRLADTYVDQLGGWAGHGLFADWRGTKSDGVPYALYPSFWVFANLYGQLGGGQIVSTTTPSDLVVVGARRDDVSPPRLALWVTNPTDTVYTTTLQVTDFPSATHQIEILDNLSSNVPIEIKMTQGTLLTFDVVIPERSSYTVIVKGREAELLDHFAFAAVSSPQTAGQPFGVTITAQDAHDNMVTGYTGPATLADTTGTLNPTTTGSFADGVWTGDVTIMQAQSDVTLTAQDGGATGESNGFDVEAGLLDHFAFAAVSSPQTAGQPFGVTIAAQDAHDNTVTGYAGPATLADTTGTLDPTTTGSFADGVWAGDVTITQAQSDVTLTAQDGGATGESNGFDVSEQSLPFPVYLPLVLRSME